MRRDCLSQDGLGQGHLGGSGTEIPGLLQGRIEPDTKPLLPRLVLPCHQRCGIASRCIARIDKRAAQADHLGAKVAVVAIEDLSHDPAVAIGRRRLIANRGALVEQSGQGILGELPVGLLGQLGGINAGQAHANRLAACDQIHGVAIDHRRQPALPQRGCAHGS